MRVAGIVLVALIAIMVLFALGPEVAADIVKSIATWIGTFFKELFK